MSISQPLEVSSGIRSLTVDDMPNCSLSDRLILELVTNEEVDLDQLAGIVEENPGLTAMVIGLANSAYFSAPTDIHRVSDAIIKVLGMRMVRSVILSVVLGRSLDVSRCAFFSVADYWTDCLTTGRYCQYLAVKSDIRKRINVDQAYLCGLLSSFGQLVLIHHYPKEMSQILNDHTGDLSELLKTQESQLGVHQGHAVSLMARRWLLPEDTALCLQHCFQTNYEGTSLELINFVSGVAQLVSSVAHNTDKIEIPEAILALDGFDFGESDLIMLAEMRNEVSLIAKHLEKFGN
ncbi:MAG: HD-like signal output (HDOD) protein [Candidatus Azotimanducaceae bacterium]|jgi:HD-like signal output (HDOD) protein